MAVSVDVGYADGLRSGASYPDPWQGSPNVVFIGGGPAYEAGALRLDNTTDAALAIDSVNVDLERPGPVFNLWGSFIVSARGTVILTQSRSFDFDTSDFPIATFCGGVAPSSDAELRLHSFER